MRVALVAISAVSALGLTSLLSPLSTSESRAGGVSSIESDGFKSHLGQNLSASIGDPRRQHGIALLIDDNGIMSRVQTEKARGREITEHMRGNHNATYISDLGSTPAACDTFSVFNFSATCTVYWKGHCHTLAQCQHICKIATWCNQFSWWAWTGVCRISLGCPQMTQAHATVSGTPDCIVPTDPEFIGPQDQQTCPTTTTTTTTTAPQGNQPAVPAMSNADQASSSISSIGNTTTQAPTQKESNQTNGRTQILEVFAVVGLVISIIACGYSFHRSRRSARLTAEDGDDGGSTPKQPFITGFRAAQAQTIEVDAEIRVPDDDEFEVVEDDKSSRTAAMETKASVSSAAASVAAQQPAETSKREVPQELSSGSQFERKETPETDAPVPEVEAFDQQQEVQPPASLSVQPPAGQLAAQVEKSKEYDDNESF